MRAELKSSMESRSALLQSQSAITLERGLEKRGVYLEHVRLKLDVTVGLENTYAWAKSGIENVVGARHAFDYVTR